jgi:transcriptional regulator with XRE-family HTH domain
LPKPTRKRQQNLRVVFGANLRAAREAKGLSQRDLAAKAEFPQAKIPAIEAGRTNLSIDTMQRLADALGLTVAGLTSVPEKK